MKCGECQNLLSRFLDQALTELERRRVAAHVEGCADCRSLHTAFLEMRTALGALPAAEPPPGLAERAAAAALRAGRGASGRTFLDRLIPIAWPTAALAVAAALLLMVVQPRPDRAAITGGGEDPIGTVTSVPNELYDPSIALLGEP